jgi:hypothetical protein
VSRREVRDFVSTTRDDLGATLDEIEHRVSPKELSKQAIHWVSTSYDRNPGRWLLGIALGAVASVAAILWAFTSDD